MDHDNIKKTKRIAAIIYLLFMLFIMGGTYLSEQQKAEAKQNAQNILLNDLKSRGD